MGLCKSWGLAGIEGLAFIDREAAHAADFTGRTAGKVGGQLDVGQEINLENVVELVNPPDRLLLSIFSCLS